MKKSIYILIAILICNSSNGQGFISSYQAVNYLPNFITAGLTVRYEISNTSSYSGSGATITDLMGNANATTYNSPTYNSSGTKSLNLLGSSSQYILTNNIGSSNYESVFMWVYPTGNGVLLSEIGQSTINYGWHDAQMEIFGSTIYYNVWQYTINGGATELSSGITLNTWHYVGFTYDGTTLTAYMDGASVGTYPIARQAPTNLYYGIGATDATNTIPSGGGGYGNFKVGAFHYYKRALSQNEVVINYNSTKASYPNGLVLNLDAGNTTSYSGTGTTWNDLSGNSNNGTLNNTTFNIANGGNMVFNGTNGYVSGTQIPTTSGNNSRTVMVWYKSTANQNTVLLDKGSTGTVNQAEQLFIAAQNGLGTSTFIPPQNIGGIYIAFWTNDIYYPIVASTLFDGNWHFVAYTYNSTNSSFNICFDGVFASSLIYMNGTWNTYNSTPITLNPTLSTTNNSYWIGQARAACWGIGPLYANASIPVVQIYNRALSNQEVINNYNALRSRFGK